MIIREEFPPDFEVIRQVNRAAFSGNLEADLVDRLRQDGRVIRSGVAIEDGRIVGHILLSPVWVETENLAVAMASLGPMAVLPRYQRRGIGSALVVDGIEVCRQQRWPAIFVVGHPQYYPRFGFSPQAVAHLKSPYAGEAFMGLELIPGALTRLRGSVRYPKAFELFS